MTMPGPKYWADLLKIKAAFDATYGPFGGMTLPVEALRSRRNGEIVEHGWMILYQFGCVDGADYLDVYDAHRMTSDSHLRIHATGAAENLPAFRNSLVFPRRAAEAEIRRIEQECAEHNESLSRLFDQKWRKQLQKALQVAQQKIRAEMERGLDQNTNDR
jgi:hypothetical protein